MKLATSRTFADLLNKREEFAERDSLSRFYASETARLRKRLLRIHVLLTVTTAFIAAVAVYALLTVLGGRP